MRVEHGPRPDRVRRVTWIPVCNWRQGFIGLPGVDMPEERSDDISKLLCDAESRGYTLNFAIEDEVLHCRATGERFDCGDARIVWSQSVDMGTDPGDDATIYLIETANGCKGYMILAGAFYADPRKVAFIHSLRRQSGS